MNVIRFALSRYFFILGPLALLAACSASNTTSTVVPQAPQSAALHPALNDANGKRAYVYVSDAGAGTVQVFTWPKLKSIGTLTGFSEPQGLCSDGDHVFVANTEALNLLEYAGGGKSPIATLADPDGFPAGCSVDPKTGDLAVANIINASGGTPGNVVIFKNATGTPKEFSNPQLLEAFSVQYDGSGDLFASGIGSSGKAALAELPAGAKHLKIICSSLTGASAFPGSLAWDGSYIVVGDPENASVERIKGCKVVGITHLKESSDIVQFVIRGNRLLGADAGNVELLIYDYPKGGLPIQTSSGGFSQPIGVAVVNVR
jgi:hypothetical protein